MEVPPNQLERCSNCGSSIQQLSPCKENGTDTHRFLPVGFLKTPTHDVLLVLKVSC
jgi:translation initiation factor 2 gamma subunit (eIF-2gamma)